MQNLWSSKGWLTLYDEVCKLVTEILYFILINVTCYVSLLFLVWIFLKCTYRRQLKNLCCFDWMYSVQMSRKIIRSKIIRYINRNWTCMKDALAGSVQINNFLYWFVLGTGGGGVNCTHDCNNKINLQHVVSYIRPNI